MVDSMAWRGMAWVVVYHVRVCLYVYTYKCVRICVCLLHTFISTYQTHLIFFFLSVPYTAVDAIPIRALDLDFYCVLPTYLGHCGFVWGPMLLGTTVMVVLSTYLVVCVVDVVGRYAYACIYVYVCICVHVYHCIIRATPLSRPQQASSSFSRGLAIE